jgi:glyoxylase-like metal-dependent hydrolase (beta-lactamase superfamily II)
MPIPIEDTFTDIIGKAQRGLGIDDDTLASAAQISVQELQELKSGTVNEGALLKVASALSVSPDALLVLAQASYIPADVPEIDGLAHLNTAFEDMTVNSFVVWDPASREAAFFDTGADGQPMLDVAAQHNLKVTQILLTHTHGDHILDLDRLKEKTKARAYVCEKEPLDGAESFAPGQAFAIGQLTVETRLTSGHSAGGVTYFIRGLARPVAIVGDSIFAGSMGGGMVSYADALRNNREQILTLPGETIICPGHGPLTTVGEQKAANPFFAS